MKKILVLATLILLVAGGLFAQVVVSGNVDYGIAGDFDAATTERFDAKVRVGATLGAYNTAAVRFSGLHTGDASTDTWFLTTDMAGVLGLDGYVWTMLTGRNWIPTYNAVSMSAYDIGRNVTRFANSRRWLSYNTMGFAERLNVQLGIDNEGFMQGGLDMGLAGMGTFGVTFTGEADDFAETGVLGIGGNIQIPLEGMGLNVGAGFQYPFADAAEFSIGAGVEFKYDTLATVNLGYYGEEDSIFNRMSARVRVMPMDMITLDGGVVLNMDTDFAGQGETLNELDVAADLKLGAATYRLGYMMKGAGMSGVISTALSLPAIAGDGGPYFNAKISF